MQICLFTVILLLLRCVDVDVVKSQTKQRERLKERVRLLQLYYFIMKYQKSQKILMWRNHDDKKTSWITYNILMSYQIQVGYRHRMYKNKDAKMITYKLSLCVKSFLFTTTLSIMTNLLLLVIAPSSLVLLVREGGFHLNGHNS